jgi:hypothetical protein
MELRVATSTTCVFRQASRCWCCSSNNHICWDHWVLNGHQVTITDPAACWGCAAAKHGTVLLLLLLP